jgi:hypothetical protein
MRKNALFQLVTALEPPGAPRKEDVEIMCGNADPDACVPVLREAFKPERVAVSELLRGQGA